MEDIKHMLFEKERIREVLDALEKGGPPDPKNHPEHALLLAHALNQYGDNPEAFRLYNCIPSHPAYEAERLWGLSSLLHRMGDLAQARARLEEALAFDPPLWLRLRIYNTQVSLCIYEGQLERAQTLVEKALVESQSEPRLLVHWILEGNRGVLLNQQGHHEEALFALQRAIRNCLALDAVTSAAHQLINLSGVLEGLGDLEESARCLERAEPLVRKSGSLYRLAYLRLAQGNVRMRLGRFDLTERLYTEAQQLTEELPSLGLKISFLASQAELRFRKGDFNEALRLIRRARDIVEEKQLSLYLGECLFHEASFLILSGAAREGLRLLARASGVARSQSKEGLDALMALFSAYGHEELKEREKALFWFKQCLEAAERTRASAALLTHREVCISLLLKLGEEVPLSDFLSRFLVQLRHPALLKGLLRRKPEGKTLFLRTLKVGDSRHYRAELARLKNDPSKEVRHTTRLLLESWSQHAGYRVHALGPLRVLFEGKLVSKGDWGRPAVKRLFLFFLTDPERWIETEAIREALWNKAQAESSANTLKAFYHSLRAVFEPWHLPGMDYAFFQSQRGAYGFFPGERIWIDYREFDQGIRRAEQAHLQRRYKEARQAYREALDLYLGDYLEEFPYEDWLNPRRDSLRETYFRGVQRYAALEKDSGNLPEARRVLEDALFRDLSRSGCTALLIRVLARMKLPREAREWGQRHILYLRKELKEKPAAEVVEALKQVK